MLSAHEGTLCLQAHSPIHIHEGDLSFASLMLNAHPWRWPFICKLDAQCTSMNVACHLQAQCSMCIHEGNLSFVSSMGNVHVITRDSLAANEMRKRFSWMCYRCKRCFNVCCSNMLPKMDWLSRRFAAMKGSQISLLLIISSCCYNNATKLLTPEGKVSEFAYQEQQTARAPVHSWKQYSNPSSLLLQTNLPCPDERSHPPSPSVLTETLQEKTQKKTYNKREEERFACTCTWCQEADEILFQAKTE
jgi:hypothetical protein